MEHCRICVFELVDLDFAHGMWMDGWLEWTYICTWSMYARAGTCSPDGPGDTMTAGRHGYLYPFAKDSVRFRV